MKPDDEAEIREIIEMEFGAPDNPALTAPYPRGLALDLVLQTAALPEILALYDLTPEKAKAIFKNPAFRYEYDELLKATQNEGFSFRQKAMAQAEAYLETTWNLVQSPTTPAPVRADLIKSTVKWAKLEPSDKEVPRQPNIFSPESLKQLENMPDHELEARVMQIVVRKKPEQQKIERGVTLEHQE